MAKRRRLIPSVIDTEFDPVPAEQGSGTEARVHLRPALGAAPPIARVAGDAAAQAALAEMTTAWSRARAEGRLVQSLPLEAIDIGHLVRDRIALEDEELTALIASIRMHGQRMPIEVTDLGGGRYGLISGWRRMQALLRLRADDGTKFDTVLALLRVPADAAEAYVTMVEENEIRLGLSYYERARIVLRATAAGAFGSEKQALQQLFSAGSRARRSKIGSFLDIVRHLDDVLRFPAAIPERLGLRLAAWIEMKPAEIPALVAALRDHPAADAAEELARLSAATEARIAPEKRLEPAETGSKSDPAREIRPGVFLKVSGDARKPVLTLSGPGLGPDFRDRLEAWLADLA